MDCFVASLLAMTGLAKRKTFTPPIVCASRLRCVQSKAELGAEKVTLSQKLQKCFALAQQQP
jgi:hypothetical protein